MDNRVKEYAALPYAIELVPDPDGGFVAEHPDLPGCFAQGETLSEAVTELNTARYDWIEERLNKGLEVPKPLEEGESSGRFLLRMPRGIHAELAKLARREGVSLNQYISSVLAKHLGAASAATMAQAIQERVLSLLEEMRWETNRPQQISNVYASWSTSQGRFQAPRRSRGTEEPFVLAPFEDETSSDLITFRKEKA